MAFNIKRYIILTVFFTTSFSLAHQAMAVEDELRPGQSKTGNISGNQTSNDLNVPTQHAEMSKPARGKIAQLEPWTHETLLDKSVILLPSVLMGGRLLMVSAQDLNFLELGSGIALGIFGADLASGIVHAIGDFISDDEPQQRPSPLTKLHMKLFRSAYGHHENPRHLVKMSYWEKTRGTNILLIPVLGVASVWGGWGGYSLAVGGMFLANFEVFHSMAHSSHQEESSLEKYAKDKNLILNREHHNIHHYGDESKGIKPFTQNFCLIQGHIASRVLNPVVSFFLKWCGSREKKEAEDELD